MKSNITVDSIYPLDQFHCLVHRQQDTAQGIRENLLESDDTALTGLGSETQELLTEITRLVTNAPLEIHTRIGDQVFEDMHREVATAVTVSTSTLAGGAGAGWRRERLSTSIELAVYILDLLSGGKHASAIVPNARPSSSDVEQAKALYITRRGTTRL